MDIQRKAFESSNNVNPDWSFKFDEELQQYIAIDFEMTNQVDEFNEHWDTFRAGWQAKAQAVPEGFVLVPKENISCYWQDNDEPENFCSNESDFDCLGDCIDLGEIMEINNLLKRMSIKKYFLAPGLLKQSPHLKKLISLLELMLNVWRLLQRIKP